MAKVGYFFLNWRNNQRPYARLDPALTIRDFACPDLAARWPALPRQASPSRLLSDLFWLTRPWATIAATLGTIRLLDVGCGSGRYATWLLTAANGHIASYCGTDVRANDHWASLAAADPRVRFAVSDAAHLRIPAGTNLFISQSAVEHFDEDLAFFEQIRGYVRDTGGRALQMHLLPSQACLRLYQLHGVRQYTPRTLSKITRLFAPDATATVYRLGGDACNRLHYSFITRPVLIRGGVDRRAAEPDEYERRLFEAISSDATRPQPSPAFYALVIDSPGAP